MVQCACASCTHTHTLVDAAPPFVSFESCILLLLACRRSPHVHVPARVCVFVCAAPSGTSSEPVAQSSLGRWQSQLVWNEHTIISFLFFCLCAGERTPADYNNCCISCRLSVPVGTSAQSLVSMNRSAAATTCAWHCWSLHIRSYLQQARVLHTREESDCECVVRHIHQAWRGVTGHRNTVLHFIVPARNRMFKGLETRLHLPCVQRFDSPPRAGQVFHSHMHNITQHSTA